MQCNGITSTISGTEASRFLLFPSNPNPNPIPNPSSSVSFTRHGFRSRIRSRLRPRAAAVDAGEISAAASEMSFYELLGISESGSTVEIKQAYKQLARKYHPDVSPPGRVDEYTQRFIRVQEAYETLSDPTMRELYDRDMAKGLHLAFSARRRYNHDQVNFYFFLFFLDFFNVNLLETGV